VANACPELIILYQGNTSINARVFKAYNCTLIYRYLRNFRKSMKRYETRAKKRRGHLLPISSTPQQNYYGIRRLAKQLLFGSTQ